MRRRWIALEDRWGIFHVAMDLAIRRYLPGEEVAIWGVFSAATRVSGARDYHPDLIERWAPVDRDMDEWALRLEAKNPFVAMVEDRVVGFAEIEESGFIDCFYVHPEFQGRGVGKALLQSVERSANEAGAVRLFANVSLTARSFFEERGFQVDHEKNNIVLGLPAPQFAMSKDLR